MTGTRKGCKPTKALALVAGHRRDEFAKTLLNNSNPAKLARMTKKDQPNFEKSLNDLQKIVDAMESGDLPLEKALEQFENGVKLIRDCQKSLQVAEQKVQILLKDKLVDFDNDDA